MRPWYRYTSKNDDYQQTTIITPFSKIWGFGAPVTLALIAINCGIWLIMMITASQEWLDMDNWWYYWFALVPELVFRGHVWQPVTSLFLHAPLPWHLFFNMYLLWVFGPRLERTFSSKLFLAFYLASGIAGSILSLLMRTASGNLVDPSLGASSSVFGLLVAYAFVYKDEMLLLFFAIPIRAWKLVAGLIGFEILSVIFGWMPIIDHWGHLGGAAGAAIWMLILIKTSGHKTAHGWFQDRSRARQSRRGQVWRGTFIPHGKRSSGFKIIFRNPRPKYDDHPEGTDDEPPPDWFDA